MKTTSWRPIVVIIVLLTAVVYVLPTVQMAIKKLDDPTWWPKKEINLGLDLQGGMHLVLEVDTDEAVKNAVERTHEELRSFVRKQNIRIKGIRQINATTIMLALRGDTDADKASGLITDEFRDYAVTEAQANGGRGLKIGTLAEPEPS